MKDNWVQTWGMAHAALSAMSYPAGRTFRLVVHSAISGSAIRVRLSNRCGKKAVAITKLRAALCTADGMRLGQSVRLTVGGQERVTIPAGQVVTTDEALLPVGVGEFFALTVYAENGRLNSGNELDDALLLVSRGCRADALYFDYTPRAKDLLIRLADHVLGIYLPRPIPLFDTVELLNSEGAQAIVCFGDSLTQEGRWTRPFEKEIRIRYPGKYSVINRSIQGNRLLHDTSKRAPLKQFYGIRALKRFDWDVLAFSNISHLLVNLGTNDILQPGTIDTPQREAVPVAAIAAALRELGQRARERGIRTSIATHLPFGDALPYTAKKDAQRREINRQIRTGLGYDHVADLDAAFARADDPARPKPGYTGGDHLHPSILGGEVIAAAYPMDFFAEAEREAVSK